MPTDPRNDPQVVELAAELKTLEYDAFVRLIHEVRDDELLGWVRYHFRDKPDTTKPWQEIVINRWLERDKFFRNVLPQWVGTVFGILSFAVSVLALIIALK